MNCLRLLSGATKQVAPPSALLLCLARPQIAVSRLIILGGLMTECGHLQGNNKELTKITAAASPPHHGGLRAYDTPGRRRVMAGGPAAARRPLARPGRQRTSNRPLMLQHLSSSPEVHPSGLCFCSGRPQADDVTGPAEATRERRTRLSARPRSRPRIAELHSDRPKVAQLAFIGREMQLYLSLMQTISIQIYSEQKSSLELFLHDKRAHLMTGMRLHFPEVSI